MNRKKPTFPVLLIILAMITGFWAPVVSSGYMSSDRHNAHMHAVTGQGDSKGHRHHVSKHHKTICSSCKEDMNTNHGTCTNSCCQSCVPVSGIAAFSNVHVFPIGHVSTTPVLYLQDFISIISQSPERPPATF